MANGSLMVQMHILNHSKLVFDIRQSLIEWVDSSQRRRLGPHSSSFTCVLPRGRCCKSLCVLDLATGTSQSNIVAKPETEMLKFCPDRTSASRWFEWTVFCAKFRQKWCQIGAVSKKFVLRNFDAQFLRNKPWSAAAASFSSQFANVPTFFRMGL